MADPKPLSTAASLRARSIIVTVPDGDAEPIRIACKRPDPLPLFASELLPLEVYAAVIETIGGTAYRHAMQTHDELRKMTDAAAKDPATYGDFIDRWACAAAVTPAVVLTAAEASDEAIWVEDLPPEVRVAIFMRTNDRLANKRVIDAVAEFRRTQRVDPDPGSGGSTVRNNTVEALVGR